MKNYNLLFFCFKSDVFFQCDISQDAVKMIQPSLRREGFSTIPNVKWEDVGGLNSLRQAFDRYIVRRIKYPEEYEVNKSFFLVLCFCHMS